MRSPPQFSCGPPRSDVIPDEVLRSIAVHNAAHGIAMAAEVRRDAERLARMTLEERTSLLRDLVAIVQNLAHPLAWDLPHDLRPAMLLQPTNALRFADWTERACAARDALHGELGERLRRIAEEAPPHDEIFPRMPWDSDEDPVERIATSDIMLEFLAQGRMILAALLLLRSEEEATAERDAWLCTLRTLGPVDEAVVRRLFDNRIATLVRIATATEAQILKEAP